MDSLLGTLRGGKTPFAIIQKQDSEELLILLGEIGEYRRVADIPRRTGPTEGQMCYDTLSMVPFCQIRERGYTVRDEGEKIITIKVTAQHEEAVEKFIASCGGAEVDLAEGIVYDSTEEEYGGLIEAIVADEIGNGEGANFVVPRTATGRIADFDAAGGLSIYASLLGNDYGTYWKFIFYDTHRCFIGSTPERHLAVQGGRVRMNPISGTFRKDRHWGSRRAFKSDFLRFMGDPKEISELFMVVDEELKMMAKMCDRGGSIIGPLVKEMSRLIHSEYLLAGESDKDIFELFIDSMFAATVVGSPVENACTIIARYQPGSRGYYGSAMMLVGRDENGQDCLDSPITIRTADIDVATGRFSISVGATLVKDSVAREEVAETKAKGAAVFEAILNGRQQEPPPPLLTRLYNDDEIIEAMVRRNQTLSNFWFFRQEGDVSTLPGCRRLQITLIHNGDDFLHMLRHMFNCMGYVTSVVRYERYSPARDTGDITVLGPGPGNPNDDLNPKIAQNLRIATELLQAGKPSLFICLGHQILCRQLGFVVQRKEKPLQGSQLEVDLFGRKELVGFYNTFAAQAREELGGLDQAVLPGTNELIALKGDHFIGYQFHPESLLTQNGFAILRQTAEMLVPVHHPEISGWARVTIDRHPSKTSRDSAL